MSDDYTHLHVHTEYSLLDGAAKVKELTERVAALGQPAVAITDHGNNAGAHAFWKAAQTAGVKPIIGQEFYVAPSSRHDKSAIFWGAPENKRQDVSGAGAYTHLSVVAQNTTGLRNLFTLTHKANAEGFYRKPRIDRELLEQHSEGLIVLSGCLGGEFQTRLRLGQNEEALKYLGWARSVFGDRFFIEIMYHGLEEEKRINGEIEHLSKVTRIPLVATNDSHYTTSVDKGIHDALLCVQTKSRLSDANRFRFDGDGYHLASRAEMEQTGLPKEALDNTLLIAEMVEAYDNFRPVLRMPSAPVASEREGSAGQRDCAVVLGHRVTESLVVAGEDDSAYVERAYYELEVISKLGYAGYFLILSDVIQAAKQRGIRIGPGRGSAGGSLVAYLLGITELDPIRHGLLFERFLNPERASLPDIDVDIAEHQRPEFLDIVREYAGDGFVATIGTLGTIGAKAALHDSARVLGYPRYVSNDLVSSLPKPVFGKQPTLADGNWDQLTTDENLILDVAEGLEGLVRSQGQHPAGVIISPEPLPPLLPLWRQGGKGHDITAFDMKSVEDLGFVKFDFLGLRNLSVIDTALETIGLSWEDLPRNPEECDDANTFRLLASGETIGTFQLDSALMRKLLQDISPTAFTDVAAVLALGRPGPMGSGAHTEYAKRKSRRVPSVPIHPELDFPDILGPTYNLLVFQEQVLQSLNRICGWSYAEADLVFGAMRKKNHAKMEASKPKLYADAQANGFSKDAVDALWATLVPFADYSFNLAHSAGYGLVSYWTAFLKANHPVPYMSALLGSVADDADKLTEYLQECNRMGIPILAPDINTSTTGFTPTNESIRYGLAAIRGVGEKAFDAIDKYRPYTSLHDFYLRASSRALNIGVLTALIKSGAMDGLYQNRRAHLESAERLALVALADRESPRGDTLWGAVEYAPFPSPAADAAQLRAWEEETLGVPLSKPSAVVRVRRALSESEWDFLKLFLRGTEMEYELRYRNIVVHSGTCNTPTEAGRSTLATLGVTFEVR